MSEPTLWPRDDHTAAKHRLLRSYLDAWIPILGQTAKQYGGSNPRLLLVDGFAGPGRYETGEEGSPLIMLQALVEHSAFERLDDVTFMFLFIEHDAERIEHLRSEIETLKLPGNARVRIEEGEYEDTFGAVVEDVHDSEGHSLVPTFAFIDPFGYSMASMSLSGRFLDFPRCELLIFLPLTHVARFVGRDKQESAMNSLFGSERWREATELEGAERREFLLGLFEDALLECGHVKFVESFELRTTDGNDYRLVFATGHLRGLEVMRTAMWSVDPVAGTGYVASTDHGQDVLFGDEGPTSFEPLLDQLEAEFGSRPFSVKQAAEVALLKTPFDPSRHLKTLTLKPAEKAGRVLVDRPAGVNKGTFANPRIRIRFPD